MLVAWTFLLGKSRKRVPRCFGKPPGLLKKSAAAFLRVAEEGATDKVLGGLFTGWSVSPDGLLAGLKIQPKPFKLGKKPSREETARGVAATIHAGLKELRAPDR